MKRISIIVIFSIVAIPTVFSMSFYAGGKEIALIDFPHYKHADVTMMRDVLDLATVVGTDLLIPATASTAGWDATGEYHDFFMVSIQPKMILPYDLSTNDFAQLKRSMLEQMSVERWENDFSGTQKEVASRYIDHNSPTRMYINTVDRLGFAAVTRWANSSNNILTLSAMVLVKGRIVWLSHYSKYDMFADYEQAVGKMERFTDNFIQANTEGKEYALMVNYSRDNWRSEHEVSLQEDSESNRQTIKNYNQVKVLGLEYQFDIPETWQERKSDQFNVAHSYFKDVGEDIFLNFIITIDD